jgi:PBP1b-binding outer membrane lipoprotein LpoB
VRIKLGMKAWSMLAAMLFSVVVISGCNNDEAPSTSPTPTPGAGAGKAPEKKPDTAAPTPTPPKTDEKKD